MGRDLAAAYPAAREVFAQADEILGFALSDLCFNGPQETLDDTINTQPALFVCGIAALRALQSQRPEMTPAFAAGHSLGEFTALAAVGAIDFEAGLRLVRERGRLMKLAGDQRPGGMAALLGVEPDQVVAWCNQATEQTRQPVVLANDNCPGQIVISGDNGALDAAVELARAGGAKRAVKLTVSIAAHSPLMQPAAHAFQRAVAAVEIRPPAVPVIGNVGAQPLIDPDAIRHELAAQIISPVRWADSIRTLIGAGVRQFIELGPGDVLTGLLRRTAPIPAGIALNSAEAVRRFVADANL
jgi:[acyl-carrier-protein] S-malonyltransferase